MKTQGPVIGVSSEAQRPSAVGRKAVALLGSATSPTPSKKLLASPELPHGQQSEWELTRQVAHHGDAQFLEVISVSNAGEHEQLWRVDGAPTQDHLLAGISLEEAGDHQSHFSRSQLTFTAITVRMWPWDMAPCGESAPRSESKESGRGLIVSYVKATCTSSHRVGVSLIAVTVAGTLRTGTVAL